MNLIIAPHADDEVLGCGGIISRDPDNFIVIVVAKPDNTRLDELYASLSYLKVPEHNIKILDFPDTKLDRFISEISSTISNYVELVSNSFIPYNSLHQDHTAVNTSSLIALRRSKGFIYEYEYAEGISQFKSFDPNYFIELTLEEVDHKCNALKLYTSQYKPARDDSAIRGLASYRGYTIGTNYAESFKLIRGVLHAC